MLVRARTRQAIEVFNILFTTYFFFAISEGTLIYFNTDPADLINLAFTLYMVVTCWFFFKTLFRWWRRRSKGHSVVQSVIYLLIITTTILEIYVYIANYVYIEIFWGEELTGNLFFTLVFPMSMFMFVFWNLVTMAYLNISIEGPIGNSIEDPVGNSNEDLKKSDVDKLYAPVTIIGMTGNKKQPVSEDAIAFFVIRSTLTYFYTNDGSRLLVDETLNQLEEILDANMFFRANRQFLISRKSVQGFRTTRNAKIEVSLLEFPDFDESITVSRYKAAGFRRWLNDHST